MNRPVSSAARWPGRLFALIAVVAAGFAFVGLSASSFTIDELYTLHLVDHDGGLAEVFHRALTDTWPPLYYFFLYEWSRLAGYSELAVRLPSAVFAVSALAIFAMAARRVASFNAVAFACAVAAISPFWFEHSQNARGYALGMALAAAMLATTLAVFERHRRGESVPLKWLCLLLFLGLIAGFTHAYLLLAFGMLLFFLLLTIANWRLRLLIVLAGLTILLLNAGYYRLLLHSTQQDVQHMWFKSDFRFFSHETRNAVHGLLSRPIAATVVGLLLSLLFQRALGHRRWPAVTAGPEVARWAVRLAAVVLVGVLVSGIAVSLTVAPSFSDRNLLICAPFAWLLLARLYDGAGPWADSRGSRMLACLIVLLLGISLASLSGRLLQRNEPWRASADFIRRQLPQCLKQPLPVVLPFKFGPATTPFRTLAERDFYGRYLPEATGLQAVLPAELAGRHRSPTGDMSALLARQVDASDHGGCNLLAWGVHVLGEHGALSIAQDLARQPALAGHRVVVQEFDSYAARGLLWRQDRMGGFVLLLVPASPPGMAKAVAPTSPDAPGDRLVVDHLTAYQGSSGPPFTLDVYSVQRWRHGAAASEDFIAYPRLTCDPPDVTTKDVAPDPSYPGCSRRPLPSSALHLDVPGT